MLEFATALVAGAVAFAIMMYVLFEAFGKYERLERFLKHFNISWMMLDPVIVIGIFAIFGVVGVVQLIGKLFGMSE